MRANICILLAMALAACEGETPDSSQAEAASPQQTERPMPVEPDGGIGDGAGPIPGTADAAGREAMMIPSRFQGVWDYEGGTCSPNSDMRMEISANEIMFYESLGDVTGVRMEGDDVVVSLDMEGEGETWQQATRFSLEGEGYDLRLHTSDGDSPKEPDEYPAKKCPAIAGAA